MHPNRAILAAFAALAIATFALGGCELRAEARTIPTATPTPTTAATATPGPATPPPCPRSPVELGLDSAPSSNPTVIRCYAFPPGGANRWNCGDFPSQAFAQAVLRANPRDPNWLDGDADGVACEARPGPYDRVAVPNIGHGPLRQ